MAPKPKTYADKARRIIKDNNYMVVATCSKDARPWATTVFYACDKSFDFYFLSAIDSRHAENIAQNPNVAVAVFDSRQRLGLTNGVQMAGKVEALGKKDVKDAIALYSGRLFPASDIPPDERYDPESYVEPSEFRFFKFTPIEVHLSGMDRKVDIDLQE